MGGQAADNLDSQHQEREAEDPEQAPYVGASWGMGGCHHPSLSPALWTQRSGRLASRAPGRPGERTGLRRQWSRRGEPAVARKANSSRVEEVRGWGC